MGEWRHLSSSDLDSSVDEELERLVAQMREANFVAQEAARAVFSDLKYLNTRKVEIGDAIDASNSALLDAEDKIEKAKEMIKRPIFSCPRLNRCVWKRSLGWSSSKPKMMKSCSRR